MSRAFFVLKRSNYRKILRIRQIKIDIRKFLPGKQIQNYLFSRKFRIHPPDAKAVDACHREAVPPPCHLLADDVVCNQALFIRILDVGIERKKKDVAFRGPKAYPPWFFETDFLPQPLIIS